MISNLRLTIGIEEKMVRRVMIKPTLALVIKKNIGRGSDLFLHCIYIPKIDEGNFQCMTPTIRTGSCEKGGDP